MMHAMPLLTLDLTCEQALEMVAARLQAAGLQVMRTFDLKARSRLRMAVRARTTVRSSATARW